jgi:transposase
MSTAVAAILNGMPEPADLRATRVGDQTVVTAGSVTLLAFDTADIGMRNMVLAALRSLRFPGQTVATVLGLTEQYVATVYQRAVREGSAGLLRASGRPPKLSAKQLGQAAAWHHDGLSQTEIGHRLGVHNSTISRALAAHASPDTAAAHTPTVADHAPVTDPDPTTTTDPAATTAPAAEGAGPAAEAQPVRAPGSPPRSSARIGTGVYTSRHAGATLLHAFTDRINAGTVFTSAATSTPGQHFDDTAVLTATTTVFALGFASMEQTKHPNRAQVGPVTGIEVLPELRTLRPRLAAIAEGCDPLGLQRAFATAMLTAEPNHSGVYFVDEHFMPYTGARPVGKGWNTKRRHAEPGRVDTLIADTAGRAVCFTTGEPSGLSSSLPATLAELRAITGPDAKIMLGFDRGGSYPTVFTTCRTHHVDWITYRRGTLTTPTGLPVQTTLTRGGKTVTVAHTDETVTINDYGPARQITLFDHGTPVLQILTSDTTSCPAALIMFMRARWRIENLFKYLDFYGIDHLTDYTATIEANTRPVNNPTRAAARDHLNLLLEERDALGGLIGALHTDPTIGLAELNQRTATAQQKIHHLEKEITAAEANLKTIPAKLPANQTDPNAQRAVHRASRRALQMVLRLLAHNAEHWLAQHLNAYLQDPDEYRAITRNLLHLGGTITYTASSIHVRLDQPNTPRLTHALTLLLQEINNTPPHLPGDPRPITYTTTTP